MGDGEQGGGLDILHFKPVRTRSKTLEAGKPGGEREEKVEVMETATTNQRCGSETGGEGRGGLHYRHYYWMMDKVSYGH